MKNAFSQIVLVLGGIIAIIIIAIVIFSAIKKPPEEEPEEEKTSEPVYEITVGDIKLKLENVVNKGNLLEATEETYPKRNITTTENFIEVTISAQNIGKDNIAEKTWNIEEIVDSQGRKFYAPSETIPWLPQDNSCGVLLKPAFTPSICTKIYEVAKVSDGLKIRISSRQIQGDFFIDLGI